MDLALLGAGMVLPGAAASRVAMATAAVGGVTALDVISARRFARRPGANLVAVHVKKSIVVNRPVGDLYAFWRNLEDLPQFMNHLHSVRKVDTKRSHWTARAPGGAQVEWDAEIINEDPNRLIAWRTLEGSKVDHSGTVRFERAPGNRGTLVRVQLQYQIPGGVLGATLAKALGEAPEKQIAVDLLRFKQMMETGEIARTEGQPAGRASSTSKKFDDFVRA